MSTQLNQPTNVQATAEQSLNKRLEAIGWGLFLILLGGIWLAPKGTIPEGTWLIGVGLILVGLNIARALNNIRANGFTTTLGILALVLGGAQLAGSILGMAFDLPVIAITLIVFGAIMLARAVTAGANA